MGLGLELNCITSLHSAQVVEVTLEALIHCRHRRISVPRYLGLLGFCCIDLPSGLFEKPVLDFAGDLIACARQVVEIIGIAVSFFFGSVFMK